MGYTIAWSGGKDSTASVILAHEMSIPIDSITYVRLMWNKYIPADLPVMTNFINRASDVFRGWGYKVNIITPKKTGQELAYSRYIRPRIHKERTGKIYGIGAFGRGCCCMTKYKSVSIKHPAIVGIAADEPERMNRITSPDRSVLFECAITEKEAFNICESESLLSPLYKIPGVSRGGCFFCPNYTKAERDYVKHECPGLYNLLKDLYRYTQRNQSAEYMSLINRRNNWAKEFM